MRITPAEIIEIIKREFSVDITIDKRNQEHTDLRSLYFYLSQRYCKFNTLSYIGNLVNRDHSNVITMTERTINRLNTKGYENLKSKFEILTTIIESEYKDDFSVKYAIKIQDYSYLRLQTALIKALESNNIKREKLKKYEHSNGI